MNHSGESRNFKGEGGGVKGEGVQGVSDVCILAKKKVLKI